MTFDEIVSSVAGQLNLTSTDAITRIGKRVNTRYKRVTSSIGLRVTRRVQDVVNLNIGSRFIEVPDIEKVFSVFDNSTTRPFPLEEISVAEMQELLPREDRPLKFAIFSVQAHSVTLYLDFNPQAAYQLTIEGEDRASTLSGAQEPAIPESFHDILEFGVKADELRKMGKQGEARDAELDFERRLGELRLHIAVSGYQDIVQGKRSDTQVKLPSAGGSSGTGTGGSSYTQTGLITFDRDPLAPFAVTAGSARVTNLKVDTNFLEVQVFS